MNVCSFCLDKAQPAILLCNVKFIYNGSELKSNEVLAIYKKNLLKLLLSYREAKICSSCSQRLRDSYVFLCQIVECQKHLPVKRSESPLSPPSPLPASSPEPAPAEVPLSSPKVPRYILPKPEDKLASLPVEEPIRIIRRQYKCSECLESFSSVQERRLHVEKLHSHNNTSPDAICSYCFTLFASNDTLKDHLIEHLDNKFVCKQCNKKFLKKGFLLQHYSKKHATNSFLYYCSLCLPEFSGHTSKSLLLEHFQTHDFEVTEEFLDDTLNAFEFENLDLNLLDILHFKPPEQKKEKCQEYLCPKCNETMYSLKQLLQHLAEQHDMEILNCNICEASFKNSKSLAEHKAIHVHEAKQDKLDCIPCQKTFKSHASWLYHKKTHSEPNTHQCPYCAKVFNTDFNLKKHLRSMHSSIKNKICALCDKQFGSVDHLRKHVLSTHDDYRKFICHFCAKSFTQAGHLKQHLAIHTTGKSYVCILCDKTYWRKIDLMKHLMKTHQLNDVEAKDLIAREDTKDKETTLMPESPIGSPLPLDSEASMPNEMPIDADMPNIVQGPKIFEIPVIHKVPNIDDIPFYQMPITI